jgi:SAM-dependent methyltransferase
VSKEAYGVDGVEGQGGSNRPVFLETLPNEWLPSIPEVHARLSSSPPARVLDVGCSTGWSSIAMAIAYPGVTVDGFDPDETWIEMARRNAVATDGPAAFATAFECTHDMARPVEVLRAVGDGLDDSGAMLVVDERTREAFDCMVVLAAGLGAASPRLRTDNLRDARSQTALVTRGGGDRRCPLICPSRSPR